MHATHAVIPVPAVVCERHKATDFADCPSCIKWNLGLIRDWLDSTKQKAYTLTDVYGSEFRITILRSCIATHVTFMEQTYESIMECVQEWKGVYYPVFVKVDGLTYRERTVCKLAPLNHEFLVLYGMIDDLLALLYRECSIAVEGSGNAAGE